MPTSKKILFLDLRGTISVGVDVLSELFVATPACMVALKTIYEAVPDLMIIVTSDARADDLTMSRLGSFLRHVGLPRSLIAGVTPESGGRRGDQIDAWLALNPDVNRYAVVDDSPVERLDGSFVPCVVYVDGRKGLDATAAAEVISLLK